MSACSCAPVRARARVCVCAHQRERVLEAAKSISGGCNTSRVFANRTGNPGGPQCDDDGSPITEIPGSYQQRGHGKLLKLFYTTSGPYIQPGP